MTGTLLGLIPMDGLPERLLASVDPYALTLMYHSCCVFLCLVCSLSDCCLSYRLQKDL